MPSPITPELVYELVSVASPSLSPDGGRLAFVRSQVDRESMETWSQIMVMDVASGESSPFTGGKSDSGPRYSPDGRHLAFVRPDDAGKSQIWVMPTGGGEARKLTDVAGGITDMAWSPDSGVLAFVSDIDPDRAPDDYDPKKEPRVSVVRRIRYRADGLGWRGEAFRHIFVVDRESGETRQLTNGEGDDSAPAWSPDGSTIAFVSDRRPDRETATHSDVYVTPASGGGMELRSQGLSSVAALCWSPSGDSMAVVGSDDDIVGAGWQSWLFVIEPGRAPRKLTDDSISPAGGYAPLVPAPDMRWSYDGRISFIADARGESAIYQADAGTGDLRKVTGGGLMSQVSFDADMKTAVALTTPPDSAGDLHAADMTSGAVTQLTDFNRKYFEQRPPAKLEKVTHSRNGFEIESRVLLPPDFDPGASYPLVLDIHGGPHGVFSDSFNPQQQVLATAGYIVLAVNPRGSSTYGTDFMTAVLDDWGGEDYLDIMSAVDFICERDYVDESRLGITGYSYGGFMSSWIIGHDTRFKAAVVGAPCINLSSMYGTSDIGVRFGEVQWGGKRWNALDAFLEHSPLTYAPNVETPALLMHGEDDHRCPIEQSEQYFVTLKRLGKEVELVRFPGSSHGFVRTGHPRLREEYLSRLLGWMDKHVRGVG
ncbi:MAG: S9 family peptidase [Dehalococcoidia bacterium]|nr:S9 family peptidase [Dehalococcoidia bacterium]